MSMDNTVKLNDQILIIVEVSKLIDKFGVPAVEHALNYFSRYPAVSKRRYSDGISQEWFLNDAENKRVRDAYGHLAPYNKIQAIKVFREITGCGLREAKDVIEYKFNCGPNR